MKHILLVVVAIVAVVISSPSTAWQEVGVSQAKPSLEEAQQFLDNYSTEPFMNEKRLSDWADARGEKNIRRVNGYNKVRQDSVVLERNIKSQLDLAQKAINAGDVALAQQHVTVLQVHQQRMAQLVERWNFHAPTTYYSEQNVQVVEPPPVQTTTSTTAPLTPGTPSPPPPPGPQVTTTATPPPAVPPSVFGVPLTTTAIVTTTAVVVGVGVAVNNAGDETTDTTGGNN